MRREIIAQKCHHGHNQFMLQGHVVAHRESADAPPHHFTLTDVQVFCGVCGERFTFEGIPVGDPGEMYKPVVDPSQSRLNVPIRPVDVVDRPLYTGIGRLPTLHLPGKGR